MLLALTRPLPPSILEGGGNEGGGGGGNTPPTTAPRPPTTKPPTSKPPTKTQDPDPDPTVTEDPDPETRVMLIQLLRWFGGDITGLLYAFDAATLEQRALWNTNPEGNKGGLWQSGQGPTADADGNIYVATGEGGFDAAGNFGNSVVKLRTQGGSITPVDSFTPCNVDFITRHDLDLG